VAVVGFVGVLMLMLVLLNRLRSLNKPEMPVRTRVGVVVDTLSVPMQCRCAGATHAGIP
jgi:hypothetical protein